MSEHDRVGIAVTCSVCGKQKTPRGRSVSATTWGMYCAQTDNCPGYYLDPKPGDLWPNETCADFGFAHSHEATREQTPDEIHPTTEAPKEEA